MELIAASHGVVAVLHPSHCVQIMIELARIVETLETFDESPLAPPRRRLHQAVEVVGSIGTDCSNGAEPRVVLSSQSAAQSVRRISTNHER